MLMQTPHAVQIGVPLWSMRIDGGPRKGSVAAGAVRVTSARRITMPIARVAWSRFLTTACSPILDLMVDPTPTGVSGERRLLP